MMRFETDKGVITVSDQVFSNIAGMAATNCFGVKGMAVRSRTDGLVHLLRREAMDKGVRVTFNEDQTISIDLHVMMDHGINIAGGDHFLVILVNGDVGELLSNSGALGGVGVTDSTQLAVSGNSSCGEAGEGRGAGQNVDIGATLSTIADDTITNLVHFAFLLIQCKIGYFVTPWGSRL